MGSTSSSSTDMTLDEFNETKKNDRVLDEEAKDTSIVNGMTIMDFLKARNTNSNSHVSFSSYSKVVGDKKKEKGDEGEKKDRKFHIWLICAKCGERQLSRVSHPSFAKFTCCKFCEGPFIDIMDSYLDPNRVFC